MTTQTSDNKSTTQSSEDRKVAKLSASLDEDVRFKFGPPPIQTFEDAVQAFLRQEIDEDELRAAQGKFGRSNEHLYIPEGIERPDKAFERTLPDDMFDRPNVDVLKVDQRIEEAERKEGEREAANKAADKVDQEAKAVVDYDELRNREAAKAVEEYQKKNPPKTAEDVSNEVKK